MLSSHERLALRSVEAEPNCDRRPARSMRGHSGSRLRLPLSVALLMCGTLFLVVMGIRTGDPVVIRCFAGLWPFTLLQAFRLLRRASRGGDRIALWL